METRRALGPFVFAVVCAVLASCGGGGGSSSSSTSNVNDVPTGIFSGTSAAGNDVFMLVESSNKYWILYNPPSVGTEMSAFDTGTATVDLTDPSNDFTVNADDTDFSTPYSDPHGGDALDPSNTATGAVTPGYTVCMAFNPQNQISGSVINGSCAKFSTATVLSVITPTYVSGSATTMGSLSAIAGSYSDDFSSTLNTPTENSAKCYFSSSLTVGSNGAINGTVTDCSGANLPSNSTVSGTLVARTDIDAFDVTLTFTEDAPDSMPLDGQSYSGIAYYDAGTKRLFIAAVTAGNAQGLGFIAVKN
jgi:hypothetical protein